MKDLIKLLDNISNINKDFIIHIKNKEELNDLISALNQFGFQVELDLFKETLSKWMNRLARDDDYDCCFRVRNRDDNKVVAYNPSIEHWRVYCDDIFEFDGDIIKKHDGVYDSENAKIEALKIIDDIKEGSFLKNIFGDLTVDQIAFSLINNCR